MVVSTTQASSAGFSAGQKADVVPEQRPDEVTMVMMAVKFLSSRSQFQLTDALWLVVAGLGEEALGPRVGR